MKICDIWFSIRDKHGWMADCQEAGYSQDQLDEMERWEDAYYYSPPDWTMFFHIEEKQPSLFAQERNKRFPQLDTRLKSFEIERAMKFPLNELLGLKNKTRIPCPFHKGTDDNFLVTHYGYCFVCKKNCDSIRWQMEMKNMNYREAVKSLQY